MKESPITFAFLPILIVLTVLLFMYQDEEESNKPKTEFQKAMELVEDITFDEPKRISVLLNDQHVDKQSRIRYNTLVFKTGDEYLPKSLANNDNAQDVFKLIKEDMPEYDFGKPLDDSAKYSHVMMPNAEWNVVSVKTDSGFYFSKWVKKTDVHQLINEAR